MILKWNAAQVKKQGSKQQVWNEELLKKADKHHSLEGIEMLVTVLGELLFDDHLPAACHYKPLLEVMLILRFLRVTSLITIDSSTGKITFSTGVFSLKATGEQYTHVVHNKSGVSVPIPDEYIVRVADSSWSLRENWNWRLCELAGKRRRENVFELFEESNKADVLDYDASSFLDNDVAKAKEKLGKKWTDAVVEYEQATGASVEEEGSKQAPGVDASDDDLIPEGEGHPPLLDQENK